MLQTISVAAIQTAVCNHFAVRRIDLLSRRRSRRIARPRQAAMWLCRHLTACSFPEIGRSLGNRDHTTVMHGVAMIDTLMERWPEFNGEMQGLLAALEMPPAEIEWW